MNISYTIEPDLQGGYQVIYCQSHCGTFETYQNAREIVKSKLLNDLKYVLIQLNSTMAGYAVPEIYFPDEMESGLKLCYDLKYALTMFLMNNEYVRALDIFFAEIEKYNLTEKIVQAMPKREGKLKTQMEKCAFIIHFVKNEFMYPVPDKL